MPRTLVVGGTGRLGKEIARKLIADGHEVEVCGRTVSSPDAQFNYAVFAQRYRGEEDVYGEFRASAWRTSVMLEHLQWASGDKGAVIISTSGLDTAHDHSVGYTLGKAAALHLGPWYSRKGPMRVNVVSPAAFTGTKPVVDMMEIADVVAFLCSLAARGINGENIIVDRGQRWR